MHEIGNYILISDLESLLSKVELISLKLVTCRSNSSGYCSSEQFAASLLRRHQSRAICNAVTFLRVLLYKVRSVVVYVWCYADSRAEEDMEMARHSPRSAMRRSSKSLRAEEEGSPSRGNGTPASSTVARTSASLKSLPGGLFHISYNGRRSGTSTILEVSHAETFSSSVLSYFESYNW